MKTKGDQAVSRSVMDSVGKAMKIAVVAFITQVVVGGILCLWAAHFGFGQRSIGHWLISEVWAIIGLILLIAFLSNLHDTAFRVETRTKNRILLLQANQQRLIDLEEEQARSDEALMKQIVVERVFLKVKEQYVEADNIRYISPQEVRLAIALAINKTRSGMMAEEPKEPRMVAWWRKHVMHQADPLMTDHV